MKRFILTGAPGSGKTAILRLLELRGYSVVEEAATEVMAIKGALGILEPHAAPGFIDEILALQVQRRLRAGRRGAFQFHDRSPVCTVALARYLGCPIPRALADQVRRVRSRRTFENTVFFVQNIGFCAPTPARRISFEDAVLFERSTKRSIAPAGMNW